MAGSYAEGVYPARILGMAKLLITIETYLTAQFGWASHRLLIRAPMLEPLQHKGLPNFTTFGVDEAEPPHYLVAVGIPRPPSGQ